MRHSARRTVRRLGAVASIAVAITAFGGCSATTDTATNDSSQASEDSSQPGGSQPGGNQRGGNQSSATQPGSSQNSGSALGAKPSGSNAVPGASGTSTSSSAAKVEPNAQVVRIVDGDTMVVRVGRTDERLRLIGINTPESVDPNRPVMCFGKEASQHLKSLTPVGTSIRIERDVEPRDKFGRLLGYVYRAADGKFVNLAQITDGYANQYTFPPNVAHTDEFRRAAAAARSQGVGLWSACEAPFER